MCGHITNLSGLPALLRVDRAGLGAGGEMFLRGFYAGWIVSDVAHFDHGLPVARAQAAELRTQLERASRQRFRLRVMAEADGKLGAILQDAGAVRRHVQRMVKRLGRGPIIVRSFCALRGREHALQGRIAQRHDMYDRGIARAGRFDRGDEAVSGWRRWRRRWLGFRCRPRARRERQGHQNCRNGHVWTQRIHCCTDGWIAPEAVALAPNNPRNCCQKQPCVCVGAEPAMKGMCRASVHCGSVRSPVCGSIQT